MMMATHVSNGQEPLVEEEEDAQEEKGDPEGRKADANFYGRDDGTSSKQRVE